MDFWSVLLICAGMAGIMGWAFTIPVINGVLIYCSWKEGQDMDWAAEIGWVVAGPFVWLFSIFEIIVLYSK